MQRSKLARFALAATAMLVCAGSVLLAGSAVTFGQDSKVSSDAAQAPLTTVAFTSPGTTSWTVPAGVTSIQVQVWGAGGAGGNGTGTAFASGYGGGGGGGAYSRSILSVTPGQVFSLTVGGGLLHAPGAPSSFGGLVVAAGGGAGQDAAASGFASDTGSGGAPGNAGSGTGTVRFSGGSGANGSTSGTNGSGGGGGSGGQLSGGLSAGTSAPAAAVTGGGAGGQGIAGGSGSGAPGGLPGGGGGGGAANATSSTFQGGPGANGRILITYPTIFTASGRVITPAGRGIRGATVTVTGNGLVNPIVVHTGKYGRYAVPGLTLGSYTFTFAARRFTFGPPARTVTSFDGDLAVADVISN